MQKKYMFSCLKFNFLPKFCVKILFCTHYFSPLNTSMRKGKDPDPYLWLMDPDGPKTCGSGSPTLAVTCRQYLMQLHEVESKCRTGNYYFILCCGSWPTSAWINIRFWSAGSGALSGMRIRIQECKSREEVLDVNFCWGIKASPVAWTSFKKS